MNKRDLLRLGALSLPALLLATSGLAQDFPPKKAVTMVVGFAPGGAADAAARLIARKLGENIGQTVVVENKAGAGGNIAHQLVANGQDDGSVLLFGSIGPLTIAPHMMKVGYDPFKDLAPISGGVHFPNVLVVNAGGNAMQDLLGNRFTGYFAAPPTALPHIETGKLIPLATTGLVRPTYLPNIPTVAESGFPGFQALNWYAFVAPGKTPTALLDRWNVEVVKVLKDPGVIEALNKHGLTPHPTTRAELTDFMRKESVQWGTIVRERKITGGG
ncbi:MAG: tripartite tricarboxylate transporter substrate binding protein [Comamonadaceae bacterium]|nr:MAG: tripartite tricarboxylate transporter substrate binding protein [Comamonadaceae bacterium]